MTAFSSAECCGAAPTAFFAVMFLMLIVGGLWVLARRPFERPWTAGASPLGVEPEHDVMMTDERGTNAKATEPYWATFVPATEGPSEAERHALGVVAASLELRKRGNEDRPGREQSAESQDASASISVLQRIWDLPSLSDMEASLEESRPAEVKAENDEPVENPWWRFLLPRENQR